MPDKKNRTLPQAENPTYHKQEMGKGVNIGGKVTSVKGAPVEVRGDKQASELRRVWGKAKRATSKFKNIFS